MKDIRDGTCAGERLRPLDLKPVSADVAGQSADTPACASRSRRLTGKLSLAAFRDAVDRK
jgi:hypothetical protein